MKRLVVVFVVLLGLAAAAAATGILLAGGTPVAELGPATVLVWRLDRPVVEWAPAVEIPFTPDDRPDTMEHLYPALVAARDDDRVKGLAVYLERTSFGLAKAQELRDQLRALSAHGKFVECYLETAGDGSNGTLPYYLASACDHVYLSPAGDLNLLGLYADSVFFSGTLDKLHIDANYNYVGPFKGAGETFTRDGHSPETRAAISAVLDSDYRQIVGAIATARGLSPERVRRIIDDAPYSAPRALELGLVDGLSYPDEFRDHIDELADEPRLVSVRDYRPSGPSSGKRVAVAFAPGTIVRGGGGQQPLTDEVFLGSADTGEMLRKLREDDSIAAVVLRIDSPGGSALASDLILREVELLAAAKPVVVSMSDLAASGGYYIAAKATKIVAEPATLTGSIGVVGGKLVTRRFQQDLLGISHDTVQRGANADLYSTLAPYSPAQAERARGDIERIYATFVDHVAEGRGLDRKAVEAVAQGRVWTGEDAHERGLVDELGGFDRALDLVREQLGVGANEAVRLVFYPRHPSLLDMITRRRSPALPESLLRLARALEEPRSRALELPPELTTLAAPF